MNAQNSFKDFVSKFNEVSLPYCDEYSEKYKTAINPEFSESGMIEVELYRDTSHIISDSDLHNYLFAGLDSTPVQNIWDLSEIGKSSVDDYFAANILYRGNLIIKTRQFIAITYECTNSEGSFKYICTYDRQGNIIDRLLCGFYAHSGSYLSNDEERIPWYAEKTFCINKHFEITTDDGSVVTYQIDKWGKIIHFK